MKFMHDDDDTLRNLNAQSCFFVAYYTVFQYTAATNSWWKFYNILTKCLARMRFHGPFCESAAYLLDSQPDR